MSWDSISLGDLALERGGSVDPAKHPDEVFELYSIPAFDAGEPEILTGSQIGSAKKSVQADDVMISRIVPHIRRACVVEKANGHRQIASGEWIIFRSKKIWPQYLRWVLVGDTFHTEFMRTVSGVGGSLLRARPKEVFKIRIPLPPLAEQKRIAGILDAADALRAKRREALAQLDTLLQATFLDMFGDPVTNPKGWDVRTLEESGAKTKVGPFGSLLHKYDYIVGGVPLVNPKHMVHGRIMHEGDETVTEEKVSELDDYRLEVGDLLVARRGEMGRCVIVQAEHSGWLCGTGSFYVRARADRTLPEFLSACISSQPMRRFLEHLSGGAIMPSLSGTQIKNLRIPIPPMDEQKEFVRACRSVADHVARQSQHLAELDMLFSSLQSRAFRGEL